MDGMSGGYPSLANTRRSGVGDYGLVAKLGQGGMADVFLAVARGPVPDFHKLVVLKRLRSTLRTDANFVAMFMKEARIAGRLSHPNVVHTYSVDIEDGHPVIVMEYLDGVAFSALLKRSANRPFAERRVLLAAIAPALSGLHYVHELTDYDGTPLQLVHRDVKPGNVLVTFDGQVKVVDFGIAKATASGHDSTRSMALKGTARYMAPETVADGLTIDRRADVFSAGVMIWETATGQRLWDGLDDLKIIRRLMDNDVPTVTTAAQDVPVAIAEICRRALQVDRQDRYPTIDALRIDLVAALEADGLALADASSELAGLMDLEFGHRRRSRAEAIKARLEQTAVVDAAPAAATDGDDPPTFTPPGAVSESRTNARPTTVLAPSRGRAGWLLAGAVAALGSIGVWVIATRSASQVQAEGKPATAPLAAPPAMPASDPPRIDPPAPQPGPTPAPAPVPKPESESSSIQDPESAPPAATPATPARAKPSPSRHGPRKPSSLTADVTMPDPAEHPPTAGGGALEPGQMPSKPNTTKPSLALDKDSPWAGTP